MVNDHALRFTGGPGGIDNIGGLMETDSYWLEITRRRLRTPGDRFYVLRQLFRIVADCPAHPGITQDRLPAAGRLLRINRYVASAVEQDGKRSERMGAPFPTHHRDGFAWTVPRSLQIRRQSVSPGGQFAVSHAPFIVPQRNGIRLPFRLIQESLL